MHFNMRWQVFCLSSESDKENPENDRIHKMIRAQDEGYSLILFPEVTHGEAEVQQPLKPGVARVLLERPHIKYVPAYMKGMAMPKNDNLIVPHNSRLFYGKPTLIKSREVIEILQQIETDLNTLRDTG